ARNAALAGYHVAKQRLAEDFAGTPQTLSGTYTSEAYIVNVTLNGNKATIKSVGTASAAETDVNYTVDATIEREVIGGLAEKAPPFMRYAVISEEDLELNGNILMDLYVEGNYENTLNANMHTNGSLTVHGMAATVRGFGTYVNSAYATPFKALEKAFNPYNNPNNDAVTQRVPRVDIPEFNAADYLSKIGSDQTSTGPVSLSGTLNLGGTREDPYVWYIQGDLSASGGVHINGYALFIVDGNVELSGDFRASQSVHTGADEGNVAIYAKGVVEMGGNADLYGQVYSEGGVVLHGTPRVYGSIASKGPVTLSGTPDIFYREAAPALTTIFEDPEVHYKLLSYSEY